MLHRLARLQFMKPTGCESQLAFYGMRLKYDTSYPDGKPSPASKSRLNTKNTDQIRTRGNGKVSWSVHPKTENIFRERILLQSKISKTLYREHDKPVLVALSTIYTKKDDHHTILKSIKQGERNIFHTYKDEELVRFLKSVLNLNFSESKLILPLLEEEFITRMNILEKEDILLAADIFYLLKTKGKWRCNQYLHNMNKTLFARRKDLSLTAQDVLQILFYIGIHRHAPAELLRHLEDILSCPNTLNQYTLNELGLICHSYFASNTAIKNPSIPYLIGDRLLTDIKQNQKVKCDAYTIVNILKAFRHAKYDSVSFHEELSECLCKMNWIGKQKIVTIAHIAKAYASLKIGADEMLELMKLRAVKLVPKFMKHKDFIREKDYTLLLISLTALNTPVPEELVKFVISIWEENQLLRKLYPALFIELLLSLSMIEVYPHNLLNHVFSKDFLDTKLKATLEQSPQLLTLDHALSVEAKGYNGNRINREYKEKLAVLTSIPTIQSELKSRPGLSVMMACLEYWLGDARKIQLTFLMPNLHIPDIRLQVNSDGVPKVLQGLDHLRKEELCEEKLSEIKNEIHNMNKEINLNSSVEILKPDIEPVAGAKQSIVIKMYSKYQYLKNQHRYIGARAMELRLLKAMGHTVVVVPPNFGLQLLTKDIETRQQMVLTDILQPLGITIDVKTIGNDHVKT